MTLYAAGDDGARFPLQWLQAGLGDWGKNFNGPRVVQFQGDLIPDLSAPLPMSSSAFPNLTHLLLDNLALTGILPGDLTSHSMSALSHVFRWEVCLRHCGRLPQSATLPQ